MERQVSFQSDKDQVFGVLHVPAKTPAAGLVMCHGFTGHKAEAHRLFVSAARDFAEHGILTLRFDFRGSGDSGGEFSEMTVAREIEDAKAALDFLAGRPEADTSRLGLLGLSLGGCVAACLAGCEVRVRALVLWAAVARPERLRDRLLPSFGDQWVFDMAGWPVGRAFYEELPSVRPLDAIAGYTGPSLVVHGANDASVPSSDASDYRLALGGRCRVHLVKDADHVFSGLGFKSEVIAISRDFLLETLG